MGHGGSGEWGKEALAHTAAVRVDTSIKVACPVDGMVALSIDNLVGCEEPHRYHTLYSTHTSCDQQCACFQSLACILAQSVSKPVQNLLGCKSLATQHQLG